MTDFTRRSAISGALLCLALAGCKDASSIVNLVRHRPRTTLVLIDTSASVAPQDRQLYAASLQALANTLEAGDRLVVAHAGADNRGAWRAALDLEVPTSDVRLDREAAVAAARTRVNRAIPTLLPEGDQPGARSTLILAAIAAGAQAFGSGSGTGPHTHDGDRLILCSDAVEEGAVVNLKRLGSSPGAVPAAIEAARRANLVPALDGVEMTVVGAAGGDAVQAFWTAFAASSHMRLVNYGRMPFRAAA